MRNVQAVQEDITCIECGNAIDQSDPRDLHRIDILNEEALIVDINFQIVVVKVAFEG